MSATARVVLVTGASSGFGRSICDRLTAEGYRVYGAARRRPTPDADFPFLKMDVDQDASVTAAVDELIAREGRLDAIVSNAGIGIAGALEDTSSEEALAQFQTNFFGNHRVCRATLPYLRRQSLAHIVVTGSLAGLMGIPFQGMYAASKFALEGYCEALRIELRGSPVWVTILEPGDFATGFTAARACTAASGEGSLYRESFTKALATMESDERGGADPILVARVVQETIEQNLPPIRRAVVGPAQAGVDTARQSLTPTELEDMIAEHYLG
jgi:NAD(P)-dependent dehydrogenase (short-subunit alcohol dehydrogenase family)